MSEAPKKIWMTENPQAWTTRDDMFNTPYIRADIVDELIKALIAIGASQGDPKAVAIQALESCLEKK